MNPDRRFKAALAFGLGGLLSALLATWGMYAAALVGFQVLPGFLFGVCMSACLAVWGGLRSLWRILALVAGSTCAYFISLMAAGEVHLHTAAWGLSQAGGVGKLALFIGGVVGTFLFLAAVALLACPGRPRLQLMASALMWAPIGGVLGIIGWALGPSLGSLLWSLASSMGFTAPTETLRNAVGGDTARQYSLWMVWQTGVAFLVGFKTALENPGTGEKVLPKGAA